MKKTVSMTSFTVVLFLVMILPSLASATVDKSAVMKKVSGLQVPFIENQGQVRDASVRYYADTFAGTVYVTDKGEIVYSLVKTESAAKSTKDRDINSALRPRDSISKAMVLRESLEGLKKTGEEGEAISLHPVGINKSVTKVNYFSGKKENWRTGIPTWREVSLGEVYQGIELKLRAYGNNVEKLFTVQPTGSVTDIRLKIEGAKGISVNKNGELEIDTALGTVKMTKPVAFQEIDGKRVEVAANYVVSGQSQGLTYGFQVGEYDNTKPLIIDPLLASTFLGGSSYDDHSMSIGIDGSGNVYVAGSTGWISDFPITRGAFDTDDHPGFISRFDSDLKRLLASTRLDGKVKSLRIDSSGNVYVAGWTGAPDFPTTPDAYATTLGWGIVNDGFATKLDAKLENLLASTYLRLTSDPEIPFIRMTIDNNSNVYVINSVLCNYASYCDRIVKLDSNLTERLASTSLASSTFVSAITTDISGNVYVTGGTGTADLPVTPDAFDTTYNGGGDAFISKFDSNLEYILGSTFLGGSSSDYTNAITIDDSGTVYVAGKTNSSSFPVTPGAFDETFNGDSDAFISKFDGNLEYLLGSTFIGGSGLDYTKAITIDDSGSVYVAGDTKSSDFPVTPDDFDTTYNGGNDVFVSKLDGNLEYLLGSTFIGGSGLDYTKAITIDDRGNVYVAGDTGSSDFPVTPGAYDETFNGGNDVFVSKFSWEAENGSSKGNSRR